MVSAHSMDGRTRKLMYFRIRKGMTLQDLSEKTGLSTATLHRLERGLARVSARSKIKLMEGLKLTVEEVDDLLNKSAQEGFSQEREAAPALRAKATAL
ncbi:MAG: helix-turn-helix transcriptional regulator [Planctomycetota bacterium]|nr:helix-turn-helix transcriptional regulator [Planctomycetota bacterium]